jgi:secreted trypsin-like serine protease
VLTKRRLSVLSAATVTLLTVLVCAGIALAITNGNPDNQEPYKYPNVGALVDRAGAYCSGTLIPATTDANLNPSGGPMFLTAAHCAPNRGNTVYVTVDPKYDAERSQFPNGSGVEYKGTFYADNTNDIAVVKFATPLTGITPAQLPKLHQFDTVAKGDLFTAVGYGATSGSSNDYGERRYAVSTFKSVDRTYLRLSQHNGSGGTCYGDSGGPNFVGEYPYANNVPTIAGITITGDTWCKSTNVTLRLDTESVQAFLTKQGVTVR